MTALSPSKCTAVVTLVLVLGLALVLLLILAEAVPIPTMATEEGSGTPPLKQAHRVMSENSWKDMKGKFNE